MSESAAVIELRAERIDDLFDPFDPFPIPSRDLAPAAEEFIVDWARELARDAPVRIVVHLDADAQTCVKETARLGEGIARHFAQRAERVTGDLRELFRVGRVALMIGLAVLVACVAGAQVAEAALERGPYAQIVVEGLIILGWVANWRPLEIFLYEWWPIAQRRSLFRRLASAEVEIRPLQPRVSA
jgi:hypothetical protein